MNQFFTHSCEQMPELEDNSVALTVTSPPYWNAIDYDIHASDDSQYYRTRAYGNGYSEYSDYLDWLENIFKEVLRVTKPGGFSSIVIGTVLLGGKHYPVPFDVVTRLTHSGWEFHQDVIWNKCTAGVKRAGVAIQKPFQGYFYPNIMTEYILVFRKPGPPIYRQRSAEEKSEAEFPINRLFTMDIANNIWHIAPVPPNSLHHPAPFPEEERRTRDERRPRVRRKEARHGKQKAVPLHCGGAPPAPGRGQRGGCARLRPAPAPDAGPVRRHRLPERHLLRQRRGAARSGAARLRRARAGASPAPRSTPARPAG